MTARSLSSTTKPLVTVYIATHNRANLLPRALGSVFSQTHKEIEVVVVDDGSNDGTAEVLSGWAPITRLRCLRNEVPMGACAARNRAIGAAQGRYVTGLDDDDEMLPDRIAALLDALRPEDAFACASDWLKAPGKPRRLRVVPSCIDRPVILARNVVGNQILAERSKVLACGGFDDSLPAAQDYDLWIRMILKFGPARGVRTPQQVIHTHAEGERISRSTSRRSGYWMVYRKHRIEMDVGCRRAHLYNLRRASGHITRLPRDFLFLAPRNRIRLIWHALRDLITHRP